jgi:hypothetical protein
MQRKEQLHEVHLALEGAVEQLAAAHRLLVAGEHGIVDLDPALERTFADTVALRNRVREELLKELGKPTLPTIRKHK